MMTSSCAHIRTVIRRKFTCDSMKGELCFQEKGRLKLILLSNWSLQKWIYAYFMNLITLSKSKVIGFTFQIQSLTTWPHLVVEAYWAAKQQTLWVIAPWRICITSVWPRGSLKLQRPSSRSELHLHFASIRLCLALLFIISMWQSSCFGLIYTT